MLRIVSSLLGSSLIATSLVVATPQAVAAQVPPAPQAKPSSAPGAATPAQGPLGRGWGEEAQQARRSGRAVEVVAERAALSRTFVEPSGSLRTDSFLTPVNYRDADGSWQAVDNTLVSAGSGWRNMAGSYSITVPASLAGGAPIRLRQGAAEVSFGLPSAGGGQGVVSGSTVTYTEVYPGVTIAFTADGDGVRKLVTLSGPTARSTLDFDVRASDGTSVVADGRGIAVTANNGDGFAVPAPWAVDAVDTLSGFDGAVTLKAGAAAEGRSTATLAVDPAWLQAPGRVWPVTVDPFFLAREAQAPDCHIVEGGSYAESNFCTSTSLEVGYESAALRRRAALRFDLSSIPADATVLNAELELQLTHVFNTTSGAVMNLHEVTQTYNTGAVSWNKRDISTGASWLSAGGTFAGTSEASAAVPGSTNGYAAVRLFPHALAQKWVNSPSLNRGLLLKLASETTSGVYRFRASDSPDSGEPQMRVHWAHRTGAQSFDTFVTEQLTDRSQLQVNVANGNLLVQQTDLALTGTGQDLVAERYYNSFDGLHNSAIGNGGRMGRGWNSSIAGDIILEDSNYSNSMIFHGPGGIVVPFTKVGSSYGTDGWRSPPALNASLSYNSSTKRYLVLFYESQLKYEFINNNVGSADELSFGNLAKVTDRNGNIISFGLNSTVRNRVDSVTDTQNRVTSLGYDSTADRLTSMTDPAGRVQRYGYDTSGRLISHQGADTARQPTRYAYNNAGLLWKITDPEGRQVQITYLSNGRVQAVTRMTDIVNNLGHTTSYSYSADLRTTTVTDGRNNATTYTLDADRRVSSVRDALGNTRSRSYTPNWTTASDTDGELGKTTLTYGANNGVSLTARQVQTGAKDTAEYGNTADGAGRQYLPTAAINPRGNRSLSGYDGVGNSTQRSGPATANASSAVAKAAFNTNGTVHSTTSPNNVGSTSGRADCPGKTSGGSGATTTFDNCTTYGYTYDSTSTKLLRSVKITPPVGALWLKPSTTNYDALGRISLRTDGRGIITTYSYDTDDRLRTTSYSDGSGTITYTYDGSGNLLYADDVNGRTTLSYDTLNRTTARNAPNRPSLGYGYDQVGNMTASSEGGVATNYSYNPINLVATLTTADGKQTTFGYDKAGRRTTTTYPNSTQQVLTLDKSGRTTRIVTTNTATGGRLVDLTYCYSKANPCDTSTTADTGLRQWTRDELSARTTTYTYDDDSQLASAATTSGPTYSYDYDRSGNRTVDTATGEPSRAFEHDAADALCASASGTTTAPQCGATASSTITTYSHDAAGNLTASSGGFSAAYNARSQTTSLNAASFTYAGPDQSDRLSRTVSGTTTSYTNGLLGTQQENSGSGATEFTRTPDGQLVTFISPAGGRFYYLFDALGSVIGLTNSVGDRVATYTYDPYGAHHTASGTAANLNPYRYTGGYLDTATGLYKLGIRYYSPDLGRFTQTDPTGQDAHYSYAKNDPCNFADPTGAFSTACIGLDVAEGLVFVSSVIAVVELLIGFFTVNPIIIAGALAGTVSTAFLGAYIDIEQGRRDCNSLFS